TLRVLNGVCANNINRRHPFQMLTALAPLGLVIATAHDRGATDQASIATKRGVMNYAALLFDVLPLFFAVFFLAIFSAAPFSERLPSFRGLQYMPALRARAR